jgi:hypothetical protein
VETTEEDPMFRLPFTLPTLLATVVLLGIATCDPCDPCDSPQKPEAMVSLDDSPNPAGDTIPAS